jgi:hypothetical protein
MKCYSFIEEPFSHFIHPTMVCLHYPKGMFRWVSIFRPIDFVEREEVQWLKYPTINTSPISISIASAARLRAAPVAMARGMVPTGTRTGARTPAYARPTSEKHSLPGRFQRNNLLAIRAAHPNATRSMAPQPVRSSKHLPRKHRDARTHNKITRTYYMVPDTQAETSIWHPLPSLRNIWRASQQTCAYNHTITHDHVQ